MLKAPSVASLHCGLDTGMKRLRTVRRINKWAMDEAVFEWCGAKNLYVHKELLCFEQSVMYNLKTSHCILFIDIRLFEIAGKCPGAGCVDFDADSTASVWTLCTMLLSLCRLSWRTLLRHIKRWWSLFIVYLGWRMLTYFNIGKCCKSIKHRPRFELSFQFDFQSYDVWACNFHDP